MLPFFVNYYQMPPHKILINSKEDVGVAVGVGVEVMMEETMEVIQITTDPEGGEVIKGRGL